jgi:hypothetical protein
VQQVKETAGQVAGQVQEKAKSQIETQKDRAAEGISSMAQALRQTGQQLRDQDQTPVAQYADTAADQIERVSNFLRERDLNDIVVEVERFARRQPALFLGGAFALGLLGARFIKSSGEQAQRARYSGDYDYTYRYGQTSYGDRSYYRGREYGESYGRGVSGGYGNTDAYGESRSYNDTTGYSSSTGYSGTSAGGTGNYSGTNAQEDGSEGWRDNNG